MPNVDRVALVLGGLLLVTGMLLGLRDAHPVVYRGAGGGVTVDPRDCGLVYTPRCDWRRESVVAATVTMVGVALCAAVAACAVSRRRVPRRLAGSIAPPEPLGLAGALVQVALPVFVVGLAAVLLTYHFQLIARLGGS